MSSQDVLNVFVDAAIFIEIQIDTTIKQKSSFTAAFKAALWEQCEQVTSIYATIGNGDENKYDIGIIMHDLERQVERVLSYEHERSRKSQNYYAKTDAYSDPEVAALAEYTKDGLKTRNKYYKRNF